MTGAPTVRIPLLLLSPALLFLTACGSKADGATAGGGASAATSSTELTPFQLENGIGPVTAPVELGPIDEALAETGEHQFEATCAGCHKMNERYVGPPLGDVLTRRTPAYVMNMILNPDTMYTRHPEARALLAQYATQMPNLHLTREQARAIVEHIRKEAAEHK
jgi:mono/diheme cytochrome c family protein